MASRGLTDSATRPLTFLVEVDALVRTLFGYESTENKAGTARREYATPRASSRRARDLFRWAELELRWAYVFALVEREARMP